MENDAEFRDWLRQKMHDRGVSQAELAEHAGVARSAVSRWLSGTRLPMMAQCYAIADLLRVDEGLVLRKAGHPYESPSMSVSPGEHEMLKLYRELDAAQQDDVVAFVQFLRTRNPA